MAKGWEVSSTSVHTRRLRLLRGVGVGLPIIAVLVFQLVQPMVADLVGERRAHWVTGALSLVAVLIFGITMFTLLDRSYRQVSEQKLEQARHLARLDELDRIAREMHDSLAQVLGTVHLRLRAIPQPSDANSEQVRDEIEELADLCHAAFQDVREAIMGLRSLSRSDESFVAALSRYARHYTRLGGPRTVLELGGSDLSLDPATQLHLLRILQEALTNVRKHARATLVRVSLSGDDGHDHIVVEDDGLGFDPELRCRERPGFGLETMQERSKLIGAGLSINSRPGSGTRIRVQLPKSDETGLAA